METYVLDKTYASAGSIGTGVGVRGGLGSPSSLSDINNRIAQTGGTNTIGSIWSTGISMIGCSESGKEIIVRHLGIAKVKLDVTSGSIVQGKFGFVASKGRIKVAAYIAGTVRRSVIGYFVNAEGKGSPSAFASMMVHPQYI